MSPSDVIRSAEHQAPGSFTWQMQQFPKRNKINTWLMSSQ